MKHICKIGTNPDNDYIIKDRTAADYHALLFLDSDNKVRIKDLNTKYGIRVNGIKVSETELSSTDDVRIGFSSIDWIGKVNSWNDFEIENPHKADIKIPILDENSHKQSFETSVLEVENSNHLSSENQSASSVNSSQYDSPVAALPNMQIVREEVKLSFDNLAAPTIQMESNSRVVESVELVEDIESEPEELPELSIVTRQKEVKSHKDESQVNTPIQEEANFLHPETLKKAKLNPKDRSLLVFVMIGLSLTLLAGWLLASASR
ncbi:MAG: FHA domain-containing protein [Bacteroidia bacterium]